MKRDGERRPCRLPRFAAWPGRPGAACWLAVLVAVAASPAAGPRAVEWTTLEPGMELAEVRAARTSRLGDSRIALLRIDPELWQLDVLAISRTGEASGHTAREWSRRHRLVAATNAGIFATDHSTHVGYLRIGDHVNNGRFNRYQSVAAVGRRTPAVPRFRIFDLDAQGVRTETLFLQDDSNRQAWRVPNVLGVRRRGSEQAARGGDLRGPAGPPGRPPGRAGRRH